MDIGTDTDVIELQSIIPYDKDNRNLTLFRKQISITLEKECHGTRRKRN